jgi:hypothetical protein
VFGVPFGKAVRIVLREKIHKSVFWSPRKDTQVLYSRLLVRLGRRKESNSEHLNLESWEWIGEGAEVDYAHMILTPDGQRAIHVDGALVTFTSEADIAWVFDTGEKRKGVTYKKFFRVDGDTQIETAIGLIRHFFPVDELVDEYFEHVRRWPGACLQTRSQKA